MTFTKSSELHKLYDENWCRDYMTDEALNEQMTTLATAGSYTICIYVDSKREYDALFERLSEAGYGVKDYNGGNNGIIAISCAA